MSQPEPQASGVHVSLGELTQAAQKALEGAGLPLGHDRDAARVQRYLQLLNTLRR